MANPNVTVEQMQELADSGEISHVSKSLNEFMRSMNAEVGTLFKNYDGFALEYIVRRTGLDLEAAVEVKGHPTVENVQIDPRIKNRLMAEADIIE